MTPTPRSGSAPRLTYTPAPVTAGDPGVKITCTNNTPPRVVLTKLEFLLPRGTGPGDFTNSTAAGVSVTLPSDEWDAEVTVIDHQKKIRVQLRYEGDGQVLPRDASVPFIIECAVNPNAQAVDFSVKETADKVTSDPHTLPVTMLPRGVRIENFQAKQYTVDAATDPVHLSWNATAPGMTLAYDLSYGTPAGDVHVRPSATDTSWPPDDSLRLTRDTLFHLQATLTPTGGGQPRHVGLTTLVHVIHPHVNAHKLHARLTTTLLNQRHNGGGYLTGYTPWNTDLRTEDVHQTFTARTDGFLLLNARTIRTTQPATTCTTVLTLHTNTSPFTTRLTTGHTGDDLLLPVPAGHQVSLDAGLDRPESARQVYQLTLYWHPLGTGLLTVLP
ncbi:hypothetical protein ACH4GK_33425 [Streptomyces rimosus]|uniref:hypothetical protein n=1 Tax=Streptomyces rimosus TaxID=1927 RepID=UPI0004C59619|nr:hypothetical protein [Streptomyces rimosus]